MVTTSANRGGALKGGATPAKLEVTVVYTDRRSTLSALRQATRLASSLQARIRLVLPSIVPYPLLLREPPVCEAHQRSMLMTLARGTPLETTAQIVYCRNYTDASRAMRPESLVVIGDPRRRWWQFGRLRGLKRALYRAGHHVITVTDKDGRHA
jgi:hypothetical protein